VNLKEFYLPDFLEYLVESHRIVAEENNLALTLNAAHLNIENVISDSHLMKRILANLLTNAIKYAHQRQFFSKYPMILIPFILKYNILE